MTAYCHNQFLPELLLLGTGCLVDSLDITLWLLCLIVHTHCALSSLSLLSSGCLSGPLSVVNSCCTQCASFIMQFWLKRGLLLLAIVILSTYTHFQSYNLRFFWFDSQLTYILICRDFASPAIKLSSVDLLFWSQVVTQSIVGLLSACLWRDTPSDSWNRLHSLGL